MYNSSSVLHDCSNTNAGGKTQLDTYHRNQGDAGHSLRSDTCKIVCVTAFTGMWWLQGSDWQPCGAACWRAACLLDQSVRASAQRTLQCSYSHDYSFGHNARMAFIEGRWTMNSSLVIYHGA